MCMFLYSYIFFPLVLMKYVVNAILAQEYLPEGIVFVTVHPGTIQTDLYYNSGVKDIGDNESGVNLPSITIDESVKGQLEV